MRPRCRRARHRRRPPRPAAARSRASGRRSGVLRLWLRRCPGWRPGSPDTSPRRRRSRRPRVAGGPAPTPDRLPRARRNPLRRSSFPAVADSSESTQRRNWSAGCMPWKLESGCPAAKATTVGTASTPNICATRGATSTLTLASDHLPLSAAARPDRVSASCEADIAARRPQQHDDRHLVGAQQHFVFEIGLGDLDAGGRGAAAPRRIAAGGLGCCLRADRSTAPAIAGPIGGRGRVTSSSLAAASVAFHPVARRPYDQRHIDRLNPRRHAITTPATLQRGIPAHVATGIRRPVTSRPAGSARRPDHRRRTAPQRRSRSRGGPAREPRAA